MERHATPLRILLDSGAQPLMLGRASVIALGITSADLEPCPFQIQTSLGGLERARSITRHDILIHLNPRHTTVSTIIKVKAIVTHALSYDVLVGGVVLYPMGFVLDY